MNGLNPPKVTRRLRRNRIARWSGVVACLLLAALWLWGSFYSYGWFLFKKDLPSGWWYVPTT
jgi:hypothetical protein